MLLLLLQPLLLLLLRLFLLPLLEPINDQLVRKDTVNRLRLHPVGLISVTIPIFRTLSTQSQMFSRYQFDIPILMRTYLLYSIIQILNKRTSRVQKTDWDVSTTATDKFILLCPALLFIHHEYKGRDVLLGTLLKLKTPFFITHIQYSCRKKIA